MGSTSGTLAGERDTVVGALVGDTIPVPVPAAAAVRKTDRRSYMKRTKWKK